MSREKVDYQSGPDIIVALKTEIKDYRGEIAWKG